MTLPPITRAEVIKSRRRLYLYSGDRVVREYPVSLGRGGSGAKQREGDRLTPEGNYTLDWRNPDSDYHLALHVSYPNAQDTARAEAAALPPGGDIMLHGLRNGFGWLGRLHRRINWTMGCIAVTNAEIEEIWQIVPDGTPIDIRP